MQLFQFPNPPLIVAITGLVLSKIITSGIIHQLGITVYTIAIIIWAYKEITAGTNWFRRLLGTVVLITIAYSLFTQLR